MEEKRKHPEPASQHPKPSATTESLQEERQRLKEFEALFHTYYPYLCATANNLLKDKDQAEDIVQEFYISCWNKSQKFTDANHFRAYAKRAILNDSIDHMRKLSTEEKRKLGLPELPEENPENEEAYQQLLETRKQYLRDQIAELPEGQREILLLHFQQQLTYAQIAAKKGISINTVRTQLMRAYKTLRSNSSFLLLYVINFYR